MLDQTKTDKLSELKSVLAQALGNEAVTDDQASRELFSQDIWIKGKLAEFVVAPTSLDDLSKAAAAANDRGIAFNPRGGGMSYTKGYTPDSEGVAILDMSKMNRIVELNVDDMYVTVEAGCTWADLHEALSTKGVRTPFWGPLSGLSSTIGGGLSQNNAFFGAGKYGTTGDSVLSVTVVLADGTIVRTGSASTKGAKPFWRHYGPDLTGIFCGDCGVLGYKAEVTLRLIKAPRAETWASYEFSDAGDYAETLAALMREDIATEIFGFDPNLTRVRMARASMLSDAKALKNVMKKQGNLLSALKEGAKVAMAGRGFMADANFNLHYTVEGHSKAGVREEIAILNAICEAHGGKVIENSIPKIIRANPFAPLNSILGPSGERWVPIHGIVPLSQTKDCLAEIEAAFEAMRADLDQHGILTGYLLTSMSTTGVIIEPVFLWPEELFEIHRRTVEPGMISKVGTHDPNPEATEVVAKARGAVLDVFKAHGAAHFQIGRTYPYLETREDNTRILLERIKDIVDPQRVINPGALGLE
jgi:D-lactate dehydrogenase (cytochrome)